jgi:SH3 domain protein
VTRKLLIAALLTLAAAAQAETRYASDELEIALRSGTSTQHRILRMIPSGTPLQVLQHDEASGYTKVRAPSGTEGWALTRLLMTTPSARDRLAAAEKKLAELELQSRQRQTRLSETGKEMQTLEQALDQARAENQRLSKQLADIQRTASSALAIDAENKDLKSSMMQMQRDQETLRQENEALRDRTARDWFMIGAGVVVVGIIIGLILPRIRLRKRSSWDSL